MCEYKCNERITEKCKEVMKKNNAQHKQQECIPGRNGGGWCGYDVVWMSKDEARIEGNKVCKIRDQGIEYCNLWHGTCHSNLWEK